MSAVRLSEKALQDALIPAMQHFGWAVAHFRPALTKHGWRTPVQGDGKGFPDLIATRGDRLLVAELKAEYGKPTQEQVVWLNRFTAVPGCEVFLWRPSYWLAGDLDMCIQADYPGTAPGAWHHVRKEL